MTFAVLCCVVSATWLQANNAFIFGGIGLAVLASGIERITTEDFYCAATALAAIVRVDAASTSASFLPETPCLTSCLLPSGPRVQAGQRVPLPCHLIHQVGF
jgi:malic enzyme